MVILQNGLILKLASVVVVLSPAPINKYLMYNVHVFAAVEGPFLA